MAQYREAETCCNVYDLTCFVNSCVESH
jgi:hypothetical protein